MAKNTSYKFTIKDFCKYVLRCWPILIVCMVIGCAVAAYSYKKQVSDYVTTATIMVFDNSYDYGGNISPYVQIAPILTSEKAYRDAGVNLDGTSFDGIVINEKVAGVYEISESNVNKEKAIGDLHKIVDNAEKVISDAYDGGKQYQVAILKEPSEPTLNSTMKDKLFSSGLIVAISLFFAIFIDFVMFNKKQER